MNHLVPDPARLAAGGAHQFTATALDRYGNEIADVAFSWDASEPSGLIDDKGVKGGGKVDHVGVSTA